MNRTIIHVDMDAFYAAVEVRDNPALTGKPLIIGALPNERGVVATCSYEARKYGIRSAMSIKEAYRRCPNGIYMHPNMSKYKQASSKLHEIWNSYTDIVEYLSLDEGYLDVTGSLRLFGNAESIAHEIKERTKHDTGLTCSIGVGYCMTAAKLASEEKKPDGFFEIPDAEYYRKLLADRPVRVLFTVGQKTAEKLRLLGITTVRDVLHKEKIILERFGKHGKQIVELAKGIDNRKVTPWYEAEAKSIGREHTFQHDTADREFLKNALLLLSKEVSMKIRLSGLYAQTITLKLTYSDMRSITRSKSGEPINQHSDIFQVAASLLDTVEHIPIRLIGVSVSGLTDSDYHQLTLEDVESEVTGQQKNELDQKLLSLQIKYGAGIIKTGHELEAEKQVNFSSDT